VSTSVRYLILSDIHANMEALEAVLAHAAGGYDTVVCCGDIVGYGPDPNAAIEWCRANCSHVVRGNHDKACAGLSDLDWFNPVARESAIWTGNILTVENLEWLRALPAGPVEVDGFAILHGSPLDEDEYLVSSTDILQVVDQLPAAVSFFGHTHLQGGFEVHRNGILPISEPEFSLLETSGYLINAGSVGQPRDGDPDAAYVLYDAERHVVHYRRAPYDITATHRKIREAGLPEVLGLRLFRGL
jgi:predicted phosphodiesterase